MSHFRGSALAKSAPLHGAQYLWEGELLGGLNDIVTDAPAFFAALDRLLALEAKGPIAICCAEGAPTECHRVWKVGAALLVHRGVDPINILRDGRDEPVSRTLLRTKASNIPACIREAASKVAMRRAAGSNQ